MTDVINQVCFAEENTDFQVAESSETYCTKTDKLGREHVIYKRTGPLAVCIRNGIFHHITMEVLVSLYFMSHNLDKID